MSRRRTIDEHPGALPHIRMDGNSVTFEFDPTRREQGARLVIRCDEHGGVWAMISPVDEPLPEQRQGLWIS